jgi:hypothetical protein
VLIRKVNLLNIALIAICFFFAAKIYRVWSGEDKARLEPLAGEEKAQEMAAVAMAPDLPVESQVVDFILDNDLFQEARKRPAPSEASNLPPPPVLNAALHGIFVDENGNKGLIQDLSAPNSRPRWVRVGESVGEFRVNQIRTGEVELEAGGTKRVLIVFGNARPKLQPSPQTPLQPGTARRPGRVMTQSPAQTRLTTDQIISQREALLNRLREARRQLPGALQQPNPDQPGQIPVNPPVNTPESSRPHQEGE